MVLSSMLWDGWRIMSRRGCLTSEVRQASTRSIDESANLKSDTQEAAGGAASCERVLFCLIVLANLVILE